MFSSIALYNNQIFVADVNGNLIAYECWKFQKKDEGRNFREKFRLRIPLPDSFHIKSILLDVVDNFSSNLKCLTIVAISLYIDISVHIFCGNIRNSLMNINTSDWLPLPNIEPNCNFFITHGPTLLFSSPQEYLFCKLPYKNTSRFNRNISSQYSSNKILQFTSLGRLNMKNPINVLLLIQSHETTTSSNSIVASCFGFKIKQKNSPVIVQEIPIHNFFPTHFQNSTKMLYVWNISIPEYETCNLEDIKWKYNYSFLRTKTDSLLFFNGTLKYIFEKPGLNISFIKTDCFEMPYSIKLVIALRSKDVYFVTNTDSSPLLHLNKTWENVETALCGDILMNGSKQLLLLKSTSYDKWQDDYILSDISDFVPVDYVEKSKESEFSMNKAMPGIQAKILAGKTAIIKTKFDIEKKMEATLDSLCKLNSSSLENARINHHISSFRESLIDIILSKEEVNQSNKNDEYKVKLSIQNHGKQLHYNHLVLFWTFSNNDNRTIYNPVLNMWVLNHHIQCFQRVIVHKSITCSIEDEFRKQIGPKENFTVIVSFEIPEFSCENLEVQAVLSWYISSNTEFENELYLPLKEKILTQQQMCLQTNMSSDEIFSSEFKDISTFEDLIFFKIIQQRVVFTISSLMTDLCNFENLVMNSSHHPNNLLLLKSSSTKILVFNKANKPLFGVHITFKTVSQNSVEVEVFTKNEKETALCEKYLCQRLPSDVLILVNGITSDESIQLKQQAVCCMKDELDLLLSLLNIHNVPEPVKNFDQPGTVIVSKENFLRIRKALLKKECSTDKTMQILSRTNFFRRNEKM